MVKGPLYSWQNAVVMDPVAASSYRRFMLEQLARHSAFEDAFSGIVIDRSDWADFYNLDEDDGVSFVEGAAAEPGESGVSGAMRVSYLVSIAVLRAALVAAAAAAATRGTPAGAGIMLMNTYGNARLDTLRHYDGSFSEGNGVNGVGLLGLLSPAILWTYDAVECCTSATQTATFFQSQLLLGVMPMVPLPGNDHAIAWGNATALAAYTRYGGLLAALATKVWALHAHIVAPVNASGTVAAKANAFVALVDGKPGEQCLLVVVAFGATPTGPARLNLTSIDRAWATPHPLHTHRGIRTPAPAAAATYAVDVLLPGAATWLPLPAAAAPSFMLDTPLADGAALVRVRVASS